MTHASPTALERAWTKLAPKLIAFLATGLTASGLILAVQYFGSFFGYNLQLPTELAVLLVGIVSTLASYIVRDKLLDLPPRELAAKVVVFALTGVTATGVLSAAAAFGLDLSEYSPLIAAGVTVLGAILGYFKRDAVSATLPFEPSQGVQVSIDGSVVAQAIAAKNRNDVRG